IRQQGHTQRLTHALHRDSTFPNVPRMGHTRSPDTGVTRIPTRARRDEGATSWRARTQHVERGRISLVNNVQQFIREDEGQDVVEYGLRVATIGLVVLAGTAFFGGQISSWFSTLSHRITTNGT